MIKARTIISKNNRVVVFDSEDALAEGLNTGTYSDPWGVAAKGGKFVWASESPAGEFVSEEAQAVLDRMTGLTATERTAIINFVNSEAANGNWALIDEFFCFSLAGATNPLIGFIAKTATNNGAVLSIEGAAFAGAEWIDTEFNPSVDGVAYTLNDAQVGVFMSLLGVDAVVSGARDTTNISIQMSINAALNRYRGDCNKVIGGTLSYNQPPQNEDLLIIGRNSSTKQPGYVNGVLLSEGNSTSTALANVNFIVGGQNTNGTPAGGFAGVAPTFLISANIGFDQAAHYTHHLQFLIDLDVFAAPVIASFPNALAAGEEDLIRSFINSQVLAGNWGKMDSFVHFGLTDATNALWDWKRRTGMTAVNAPTHTPGVGYAFNGTTQYIDSGVNPTTATNYTQDNAQVQVFVVALNRIQNKRLYGAIDTNTLSYRDQIDSSRVQVGVNGAAVNAAGYTIGANQLIGSSRVASTGIVLLKDAAEQPIGSSTSLGVPNINIYIGCLNSSGSPSEHIDATYSSFIAGAAIDFNQSNYYDNLVILNNAL